MRKSLATKGLPVGFAGFNMPADDGRIYEKHNPSWNLHACPDKRL
jgi:hypothetical protein